MVTYPGYATDVGEVAFAFPAQPFQRATSDNLLIAVRTPETPLIYGVYDTFPAGSTCVSYPSLRRLNDERYSGPAR